MRTCTASHSHQQPAIRLTAGHHLFVVASSLLGNKQLPIAPTVLGRSFSIQQTAAYGSLGPPTRDIAARAQRNSTQQQQYRVLQTQRPPEQQLQRSRQHTTQLQQPVWGYLTGTDADQWTWDDDYNPSARARAAAEAQQLPPTPRQQAFAQQAAVAAQQQPTVITRLPEQFSSKVLLNGVLLVDKPPLWSNTDIIRQMKNALKVKKIGVGAPLDAQATGLLIVLFGAATRLTPKLEPLERTYTGTIKLGVTTTTYDFSGQTLQVNPWQHLTDSEIQQAAAKFVGEVMQVPCMWSSTKFKNRPLRWYAERGETVVREPKAVQISSVEVWREKGSAPAASSDNSSSSGGGGGGSGLSGVASVQGVSAASHQGGTAGPKASQGLDEVHFRVVASKGASMRVLADDLGKALGCGAHLASLRRERIGGFSVDTAWSLDVLLPLAKKYGRGFKSAN